MSEGQSLSSKINHVLDSSLNSRTLTQVKINVYLTIKYHNITDFSIFSTREIGNAGPPIVVKNRSRYSKPPLKQC